MRPDRFSLAKAWIHEERSTPEEARATWDAMDQEFNENRKIFLASAESDKIKAMMNKKFGSGTMKYGSEISQPPARPDVIEIDALNAFMKRNPAAEGGRMRFDDGLSAKQKKALTITYPKDSTKDLEIKKAKGDLTEGILKAYSELGKGKNTTSIDIYNKIKDLDTFKNYSRRDLLVTIGKRLRTNNKPYTKTTPATSDAFEETKQAKRKIYLDKPVDQPTLVYEVTTPGKPGKIINIKFPETGNNTKADFKKAIENYYSIPKDDNKIKVAKNKIIKDFFPDGLSDNQWNKLVGFFNKEENIDTKRPYLYGDEGGSQLKSRTDRISRKEEFSDKIFEDRISDEKRNIIKEKGFLKNPNFKAGYEPIDLAHRLSLSSSERFGTPQRTGTIGLDRPVVNQVFVEYYQSKLNKVYNLQKDLIANKPEGWKKKLEAANKLITSIVNDADNRIVGVTIDEITLKPKLFGDKFAAKYAIDQGLFDTEIKKLKPQDKEFIKKFLLQDQIIREVDTGLDVKNFKNINKDSITKWMNKTDKFKNSEIKKQALKILEDNPQITQSEGVLGTKDSQPQIKKLIESIGCPVKGKGDLLAQGGRIGFAEGGDCFDKGQKLINNGMKGASPAQLKNLARLGPALLKAGSNLMSGLILPEALIIGLETAARVGYGDTPSEAILRATDYLTPDSFFGDFLQKADLMKIKRTLGNDVKNIAAQSFDRTNQSDKINSLEEKLKNLEAMSESGDFGYIGDLTNQINMTKDQIKKEKEDLKNKFTTTGQESKDFYTQQALDNAYDASIAKSKSAAKKLVDSESENPRLKAEQAMQDMKSQEQLNKRIYNIPKSPLTGSKGETAFLNLSQLPMGPRMGSEIDVMAKAMNDERIDANYLKAMQDYKQNWKDKSIEEMIDEGVPLEAILGFNIAQPVETEGPGYYTNYKPLNRFGSQERPVLYPEGRGQLSEGGITALRSKYEYKK